jgi:hypothetical protein
MWTMHCQSASCVLELWLATAQACTDAARRSQHGQGCACNHPKSHHLICSWATLLSACRPTDPLRLVTCDDADNMCSPAVPYTGQFNWQLFSVTIEIDLAGHAWCSVCRFSIAVTVQWTTAGIARSCSDPLNQVPAKVIRSQQTSSYCPFVSTCICSYRYSGCCCTAMCMLVSLKTAQVGSLIQIGTNQA